MTDWKLVFNRIRAEIALKRQQAAGPPNSPTFLALFELRDREHIACRSLPADSPWLGLYEPAGRRDERAFIHLRWEVPEPVLRFTLAHELGHFYSDRSLASDLTHQRAERMADGFACAVLPRLLARGRRP